MVERIPSVGWVERPEGVPFLLGAMFATAVSCMLWAFGSWVSWMFLS